MKDLPKHLVAIPDGNRRWAKNKGLVPWEGHREGVKKFWEVCEEVFQMGVPYFTFWAASEDNLKKRSRIEVKFLVLILKNELFDKSLFGRLEKNEVRLRVFGRWNEILESFFAKILLVSKTKSKASLRLSLASFRVLP